MNWGRIEGNWKQLQASIQQQWGKLTDDQLVAIAGKRDRLTGRIQETYDITRDEAEKQIGAWQLRQKMHGMQTRHGNQAVLPHFKN